jgi:tetraacyldisaccharide 4'-kinase
MLSESQFKSLVSGQWKGPVAAGLRGALAGLEVPYSWAIARKNRRFDSRPEQAHKFEAPIISVGNLTVGGTGKTPFVCWLANWFLERGTRITLISRGYGRPSRNATEGVPYNPPRNATEGVPSSRGEQLNDEAAELATKLPGVPHIQNPDRVAAAKQALQADPRQVLILDDAFQHRRIARDLDIVLLDALEPFGYGHLLPRGLLREPIASLKRAHVVALSRSDAVSEARCREIQTQVERLAPQAAWLELAHQPTALVSHGGEKHDVAAWRDKRVAAFCGIGNPAGFRHTLAECGLDVADFRELPDHFAYPAASIEELEQWAGKLTGIEALVCTRKDLVKLPRELLGGVPLVALEIELAVLAGREQLERMLGDLMSRKLNRPSG